MTLSPLVLATALALALAAPARAADPLLSGYGGPGGGEQAVLGERLLQEGAAAAQPRPLRAAAPSSATASDPDPRGAEAPTAAKGDRGRANNDRRDTATSTGRDAVTTTERVADRTPTPVAVDAAGAPVDAGLLVGVALAAVALVLLGVGLRRIPATRERGV